ncbi:MAG: AraC family transcriptional regulator [Lachnospiraceae bacterium]|nr:AraC family transcriptional regulator [Lachnospiraceae bacterium]
MNEITINTMELPVFNYGDFLMASEPFIHADRTMEVNVLIYVVKGQITVTEGEIDYEINPGELLFLKSGIHHYGKQEISQGTAWYYVHFYLHTQKDRSSESYGIEMESEGAGREDLDKKSRETVRLYSWEKDVSGPIMPDEKMEYAMELPKKLSCLTGSFVEQRLIELIEEVSQARPFRRWELNNGLYGLLTEIAFYQERNKIQRQTLSDRIVIFLEEHRTEPFDTRMLEQEFFLSYKHMAAVFKREKGQTMQQCHRDLRMHTACKLLRSTLLPIGEISARVGYADMLYFSRCFHQCMHMSPREYRKINPMSS